MSNLRLSDLATNELGRDAWGKSKVTIDYSLFHGMFTYNVPLLTWYESINGVVTNPVPTNCVSVDGALEVSAGSTLNDTTFLTSFRNPRYEPNRGTLYSTAGWITNPTALMTREWGTFNAESGVFFRLKAGGTLVGIFRTTIQGVTSDTEIPLTIPDGVDLSKGNVFDIQYQWRGAGNFKFFINLKQAGNSNTLGTLTNLSIFNPALPIAWGSENLGDNDVMNFGCVDVTSEGGVDDGNTYGSVSIDNTTGQIALSGFNQPVMAVRVKTTVNGLINTRDTLALELSAYSDQRSFLRVWRTRDFSAIIDNDQVWADFGDGHLESIQYDNPTVATPITFDTSKTQLIFGCRVSQDETYVTSAMFEGRTEIYLTAGDMLVFTMHRENGGAINAGVTFEFAEAI